MTGNSSPGYACVSGRPVQASIFSTGRTRTELAPALLRLFESLPEYALAAYRVHRHPIAEPVERNDGRRLAAGQQLAIAPQRASAAHAA